MKKVFALFALALMCSASLFAQEKFRGSFHSDTYNMHFTLGLDEKDIDVPGLEGLETCYGFLMGNINGRWDILRVKSIDEKTAVVRIVCDKGDVAEDIRFTLTDDNTIEMEQLKDSYIKGIENRKYVKLPKTVVFKRK